MQPQPSMPSPILFFDTVNAFQRTQVLKGALELELFTAIAEGNKTPAALALRCEATERGVRIMCDYLTTVGFLTKDGGSYNLTEDTAIFLDKRSPAYLGGSLEFLLSPTIAGAFDDIAGIARKGGTLLPKEGSIAPDHPIWVNFARGMGPLTGMPAQLLAKLVLNGSQEKIKVLDIAAGHGRFGVAFAQQNPNAEIVAQDWPKVLEVALDTAAEAGVADRFSTIPGSAFDVKFGDNFDVVLLTNFLHHFDPETCVLLLKKIYSSLNEGGVVVTLEFVPDENRVTPPPAAVFSMVMLATTPSGDAYTHSEFERMFADAGFTSTELHELPPTPERVLISRK
jgi:ubiquinone/menaquinone biosynthesis C-methylase UbiE